MDQPEQETKPIKSEKKKKVKNEELPPVEILDSLEVIIPPEHFCVVEPGIYRSNTLLPHTFHFIKTLRLRTVVRLSPDEPINAVSSFYRDNNIRVVQLGAKTWTPSGTWKPTTEELVKEALELILDRRTHPVMVCCTSGIYQTGTVVACLRRLQHWSLNSIVEEFRQHGFKYANELFTELMDTDLVTLDEAHLPDWFVEQQEMHERDVQALAAVPKAPMQTIDELRETAKQIIEADGPPPPSPMDAANP